MISFKRMYFILKDWILPTKKELIYRLKLTLLMLLLSLIIGTIYTDIKFGGCTNLLLWCSNIMATFIMLWIGYLALELGSYDTDK